MQEQNWFKSYGPKLFMSIGGSKAEQSDQQHNTDKVVAEKVQLM